VDPAALAAWKIVLLSLYAYQVDEKVAIVYEQFIRLMIDCGLPQTDMDYIYSSGPVMNELLVKGDSRMTRASAGCHNPPTVTCIHAHALS
jgi:hypothetical protein